MCGEESSSNLNLLLPLPPAIKSNLLIVLLSAMVFPSEKETRNHFVCLIIIFFQLGQYFIITLTGHTIKQFPFICATGKRGRRRAAAGKGGRGGGEGSRSARLISQEEKG